MSKRQVSKRKRHAQKSCKRKRTYNAQQAAKLATERGLSCYRCPNCKAWHLTKRSA